MTSPSSQNPSEIDQLKELVQKHHERLHHGWHTREPLVTTEGSGARCVGVRCYLEPELFGLLEAHLAERGMATLCCPEEGLSEALGEGWEPLHIQPDFAGVEFVVEERVLLCREA